MLLFSRSEDCCGCTACQNICPNKAISMQPDEKGFLYPNADPALCINCGLCKQVCSMKRKPSEEESFAPNPIFYAVKHKSGTVRMQSSSGGMFTAVSDWILEQGGAIYGASFDDGFRVCHRRTVTKEGRDAFRGSKYVQSDLGLTFSQVKRDLASGLRVLYTGTPCQIAGLRLFLKSSKSDLGLLYLCDLICHGTPSPLIWKDYLTLLSQRYRSSFEHYSFRDKKQGWRDYNISVIFQNGLVAPNDSRVRSYVDLFTKGIDLRPCCYKCPYANLHRPSDLTIGDFWGIEKAMPDFEDEKGVSLVLVNTEKGQQLFKPLKGFLEIRALRPEEGMQWNLQKPTAQPPKTRGFWKDYQKHGFKFVVDRYVGGGVRGRIKNAVKSVLKELGLLAFAMHFLRRN